MFLLAYQPVAGRPFVIVYYHLRSIFYLTNKVASLSLRVLLALMRDQVSLITNNFMYEYFKGS